jgi:hypothetical protein
LESVLSRQAGRGGLQYRDLVIQQLQSLQARGDQQTTVYH